MRRFNPALAAALLACLFTAAPGHAQKLVVDGVIDSSSGGFRFPDDTVQVSAASADEVRTAISSIPYTIDDPGSYYLTGNLTATAAGNAVTINASDVTLDLMGFVLDGDGIGGTGVAIIGDNVEVRDGTVRNFMGHGVAGVVVVDPSSTPSGARVIGIRATGNGYGGISIEGDGAYVAQCLVAGNGSIFEAPAIYVGSGMVRGCVARSNQGSGISVGTSGAVADCHASDNNIASSSLGGGIHVVYNTQVTGNTSRDNLVANILVEGSGNAIVANQVSSEGDGAATGTGIKFLDGPNIYRANRASGLATAFDLGTEPQYDGGGNWDGSANVNIP